MIIYNIYNDFLGNSQVDTTILKRGAKIPTDCSIRPDHFATYPNRSPVL